MSVVGVGLVSFYFFTDFGTGIIFLLVAPWLMGIGTSRLQLIPSRDTAKVFRKYIAARPEAAECAAIPDIADDASRELLQAAGLSYARLSPYLGNPSMVPFLATELEKAGITSPGARLDILQQLQEIKERELVAI